MESTDAQSQSGRGDEHFGATYFGAVVKMKQSTTNALLKAYNSLQEIVIDLYNEFQKAMENRDNADASLLEARAEILFEQAESIIAILEEQSG